MDSFSETEGYESTIEEIIRENLEDLKITGKYDEESVEAVELEFLVACSLTGAERNRKFMEIYGKILHVRSGDKISAGENILPGDIGEAKKRLFALKISNKLMHILNEFNKCSSGAESKKENCKSVYLRFVSDVDREFERKALASGISSEEFKEIRDSVWNHNIKVRVVLIYPRGFKEIKSSLPSSLLSLAGIVKDDCEIKIIDMDFEPLDFLESHKVDIIGIQLYDPATYSQDQLCYLKDLLTKLRKFNALIVAGGWGGKSRAYVESGLVDVLTCGLPGTLEQPFSFKKIINAVKERRINPENLREIPGIIFRDSGHIIETSSWMSRKKEKITDFFKLPPEDDNFEKYGINTKNYVAEENRRKISTFYTFFNTFSCGYYKCHFCSQAEEFGNFILNAKKCRKKINFNEIIELDTENAAKKIENCMNALNAEYYRVAVSDDIFDVKKIVLLIEKIKSKGFFDRIKELIFQVRPDYITEENVGMLIPYKNIIRINLGLESFNNYELSKMQKFPSRVNGLNKNLNAISLLEENGFRWNGTIIFTHWSTLETVKENFFQYFNLISKGYNMSAVNSFYGLFIVGKLRNDEGPKEYKYLGKYIRAYEETDINPKNAETEKTDQNERNAKNDVNDKAYEELPFVLVPSTHRLTAESGELIEIKNFIDEVKEGLSYEEKKLNSRFLHGFYKLREEINIELYRREVYDELTGRIGFDVDDRLFQMILDLKRQAGNLDGLIRKINEKKKNEPEKNEPEKNEPDSNFIESIILDEMREIKIKTLAPEDIPELAREASYQILKILGKAIKKKEGREFEQTKQNIESTTLEVFNGKIREIFEYKITGIEEIFNEIKEDLIESNAIDKDAAEKLIYAEPEKVKELTPEEIKKVEKFIEISSDDIVRKACILDGNLRKNAIKIAEVNVPALRKNLSLLGLSDKGIEFSIKQIGVKVGRKVNHVEKQKEPKIKDAREGMTDGT